MDTKTQAALEAGARQLGVTLDSTHLARFDRYLDALLRWNAHIKLTSVTAPAEVVDKHFLDSLAVVPAIGAARELVDIGSGAGFPGLVVAAVRPEVRVTVVESIQKKAAFLEAVKRELGLTNVEVLAARMESLIDAGRRFEAAVSRATFAPSEWVERGEALVAEGGRLVAMVVPGETVTADSLAPRWRERFQSATLGAPYAAGRALLVLEGRLGTRLTAG